MIDHVLGRPSIKSRRLQVLAVLAFWTAYLARGNKNGPPGTQSFSKILSKKLTAWQIVLLTMLYLYAARNFSTLVGLASPDPLANMYDPSFFRATWILTALDAGFWTAMKIRTKWVRELASIVFSGFYMVAAEKADEKVRKVRGNLTVEHLRVSWNKGTTPYIRFLQGLTSPRLTRWPPRLLRIPRPNTTGSSDKHHPPIMAWLYYDGSLEQLRTSGIDRVIMDIPGGGFVAMDPRCNDDRLLSWAVKTGLPVVSLDYKKAPEYPFPYALNECYDAYSTLVQTRGRCIGLAAESPVRIVVAGDSAGGNLATAMTLMLAQQSGLSSWDSSSDNKQSRLPLPDGLILVYPCMDVNIGNWMSDEQMALMQDRRTRAANRNVLRRKAKQYSDIAGTPHETDDEDFLAMTPAVKTRAGKKTQEVRQEDADADDEFTKSQGDRARTPQPAYSHVNLSTYSRPQTPATEKPPIQFTPLTDVSGAAPTPSSPYHPVPMSTRLATASTISYFNDRVLTPEMMRAMIILYVGPHNRPDFSQDYLLSPILAPDLLLAHFPKTYFLTGERDPLVDDTVIFSGRLRRIKMAYHASGGRRVEYRESDAAFCAEDDSFDDRRDVAEVMLIPGVSHGFLQFPAVYPPAWQWFQRSAQWIEDVFTHAEEIRETRTRAASSNTKDANESPAQARRGRAPSRPQPLQGEEEVTPSAEIREKKGKQLVVDTGKSDTVSQARPQLSARTESSGDEAPLEMMRMTKSKTAKESTSAADSPATTSSSASSTAATTPNARPSAETKAKKPKGPRRPKDDSSLVKLKSSDDLLGRRMQGIVGSLSGVTEE
ncbi:hormone-sensitive lipase [Ophiostoma piceae UAMH 11346]|uniref:Hormone-sensitive lipase n=1 Tax=Ophiostoma piceae (strain UAMH 11346) TaxID=1262450 RepID=S3C491_OPHP1|nr:hormone-sensitive lipase [Ophiostoma piceae UAMH 11346]